MWTERGPTIMVGKGSRHFLAALLVSQTGEGANVHLEGLVSTLDKGPHAINIPHRGTLRIFVAAPTPN
jgi:hypothetical protein